MSKRKQSKTFSERILRSPKYPNGRGEIFLRNGESPVYQVTIWLPTEQKQLRRSLSTRDYDTALIRAEEMINEVHGKISNGVKMFGLTLGELVERYLDDRQKYLDAGDITQERDSTIRSQTKALLSIRSGNLKLTELDKDSFQEWRRFRKEDNPNVRKITLRNEQATFNAMFKWAYSRKLQTHIPKLVEGGC